MMFEWIISVVLTAPIWCTFIWHVWELNIKPQLIPLCEISALAHKLRTEYGVDAEERAVIEEFQAWLSSDTFQQGTWRRVIEELRKET